MNILGSLNAHRIERQRRLSIRDIGYDDLRLPHTYWVSLIESRKCN